MKRISIIVPVLNEAGIVIGALAALQQYRERGCELIVVDGGSADGTPELARAFADRVLSSPRGRGLQMNAGAAAAGGHILVFLHVDTGLPARADSLIRAGLASGARSWGHFAADIHGSHPLLAVVAKMMSWRSRLTGIATGDQAIFVTREGFQAAGGFRAQPLMEDIELSRALKRRSRPLCLADRVTTSGRRWERRGVVRTILLMWWLRWRYSLGAAPELLAHRYDNHA